MCETVVIVGTGRVAQSLGRLLHLEGYPLAGLAGTNLARTRKAARFVSESVPAFDVRALPPETDRLLIAVADDHLSATARILGSQLKNGGIALHTSGVHASAVLDPLGENFSRGALHPLQTIATPEQGLKALPGAAYVFEGDEAAAEWAGRLVALLAGRLFKIEASRRALYHAAAVMASNYVTGLIAGATDLLAKVGFSEREALDALAPLLRSSVENTLRLGPVGALTGPIERGDVETIRLHRQSLEPDSTLWELYRAAGLQVLRLAGRKGLSALESTAIGDCLEEGRARIAAAGDDRSGPTAAAR